MSTTVPFEKGLREIGAGLFAYLQPDGSWGFSNAGLVADGGQSLLVDTLFDRALTREMLAEMKRVVPDARMETVVNTHANGDHCWGNQELPGSRIVSSRRAAEEMRELPPSRVQLMVQAASLGVTLGPVTRLGARVLHGVGLHPLGSLLDAAPFVKRIFGPFQFGGITLQPPTDTFEGTLTLNVGSRRVELLEVGPAHTRGDAVVHIPDAGVVFTGDILFINGHPIVWEGPLSNWIAALDRVAALKPTTVVPGHGPLTDLHGVAAVRDYLAYVETEATRRHAAGMDAETAAKDIALDAFSHWLDAERIAVNVETVYRHLEGRAHEKVNVVAMFGRMARVASAVKKSGGRAGSGQ